MKIIIGPIDHHALPVEPAILQGLDYSVLEGSEVWTQKERDILAPPPDLTVSQWADDRRVLQHISRRAGKWSTDYTPYLRPIMDAYNDPNIRHIVICAGTQLGKTETLYNIIGYIIDLDPASILLVYPREDDAKGISRTRLQPMIEDCPTLRAKKPEDRNLYQSLEMHFPGMILYIVGANSPAALAQKPCRVILRDEIDKYPEKVGKDADPLSLSEERAKSFWDIRKVVDVSSPTVANFGILNQLDGCHVVYKLHAPCPHCLQLQKLQFKSIKFDDPGKGDPNRIIKAKKSAYYVCNCGAVLTDGDRPWMIANCEYVADRELEFQPEKIGFWLSSLYSPMLTWGDVVENFLEAQKARDEKGNLGPLQNFINGWLAEEWKETVKTSTTEQILSRRSALPPLVVPADTMAITAGIDAQKYGFWFSVWAWSKTMASHLVHYGWLDTWEEVSNLCFNTRFQVLDSPHYMGIWRAGMDIGGGKDSMYGEDWTKTEEIIQWLRDNGQGVVFGVKGMSANTTGNKVRHSVLDKMPGKNGGPIPGGITIWLIDTHMMKDTFFWRLSQETESDPQKVTLHAATGDDFAKQLLAEEKRRGKNGKMEYVQIRKDNHYLDTCVYGHACADFQWMGGVSILHAPQFALNAPGSLRRPPVKKQGPGSSLPSGGGLRDSVNNFQRPSWLNRR